MKKSVLTGAVSILLAAVLAFGAPAALAAEGEAPGAGPLDLEQPNKLTVQLENKENFADDLNPAAPEEGEAPAEPSTDKLVAPAVVDLYLVAEAVKIPGSDGYEYQLKDSFKDLTLAPSDAKLGYTAEEWEALARQAAGILFPADAEEPAVAPVVSAHELGTIEGLDAGLYLLVPHGKGLDLADYVEHVPGTDEAVGSIVTKAFSELYAYSFTPYLVSLPGRNVTPAENGDTTGGNTADGTGWSYDVTTYLKVTREPRYGQLEIVKGIDAYMGDWNASFVFEIEATMGEGEDQKVVYRNVVGLDFNDGELEHRVRLDRIPAGSTVTVTEVYSGASYTAAAQTSDPLTISATELARANFTNKHNDRNSGGYGANNHYTYNEEAGIGGWNSPAQAPAEG